jgi:AraC-like DNA-binding protein
MELLLEIHARQLNQPRHQQLARLLEEIGKAPGRPWPLQEMAAFCHCSTAQLRRNMLEYTGMLPKECVEGIRFQYAAEMLTMQELPIDEVARRLGYPDRFHFSRRFKAFFGIAPGHFQDVFPKRHA